MRKVFSLKMFLVYSAFVLDDNKILHLDFCFLIYSISLIDRTPLKISLQLSKQQSTVALYVLYSKTTNYKYYCINSSWMVTHASACDESSFSLPGSFPLTEEEISGLEEIIAEQHYIEPKEQIADLNDLNNFVKYLLMYSTVRYQKLIDDIKNNNQTSANDKIKVFLFSLVKDYFSKASDETISLNTLDSVAWNAYLSLHPIDIKLKERVIEVRLPNRSFFSTWEKKLLEDLGVDGFHPHKLGRLILWHKKETANYKESYASILSFLKKFLYAKQRELKIKLEEDFLSLLDSYKEDIKSCLSQGSYCFRKAADVENFFLNEQNSTDQLIEHLSNFIIDFKVGAYISWFQSNGYDMKVAEKLASHALEQNLGNSNDLAELSSAHIKRMSGFAMAYLRNIINKFEEYYQVSLDLSELPVPLPKTIFKNHYCDSYDEFVKHAEQGLVPEISSLEKAIRQKAISKFVIKLVDSSFNESQIKALIDKVLRKGTEDLDGIMAIIAEEKSELVNGLDRQASPEDGEYNALFEEYFGEKAPTQEEFIKSRAMDDKEKDLIKEKYFRRLENKPGEWRTNTGKYTLLALTIFDFRKAKIYNRDIEDLIQEIFPDKIKQKQIIASAVYNYIRVLGFLSVYHSTENENMREKLCENILQIFNKHNKIRVSNEFIDFRKILFNSSLEEIKDNPSIIKYLFPYEII